MTSFVTRICTCSIAAGGDNHEPPIGFGGGSFFIDVPNEIKLVGPTIDGSYDKYEFEGVSGSGHEDYEAIRNVGVLTEVGSSGSVVFDNFKVEKDVGARLRLWLRNNKNEPTDPTPDIIIDGADGGSIKYRRSLDPLNLESPDLPKARRKKRFKNQNPAMSVVKWQLVDVNNDPVMISAGKSCADSTDDLYYIYVSFHHED